jgi:hypothetical protein
MERVTTVDQPLILAVVIPHSPRLLRDVSAEK